MLGALLDLVKGSLHVGAEGGASATSTVKEEGETFIISTCTLCTVHPIYTPTNTHLRALRDRGKYVPHVNLVLTSQVEVNYNGVILLWIPSKYASAYGRALLDHGQLFAKLE